MKKLLVILITVLSIVALVTPTYAMSARLRQAQAEEVNKYNNEITFRNIPWGSTLSTVKEMISDMCNPEDIVVLEFGGYACKTIGLPEDIADSIDFPVFYMIKLNTEENYSNQMTQAYDVKVAGHDVKYVWLWFLDEDLNPDTEPKLYKAQYQIYDCHEREGLCDSCEIYNDIIQKLNELYVSEDRFYYEDVTDTTYRDYSSNYISVMHYNFGGYLESGIDITYNSNLTDDYIDCMIGTYYDNLHATWDTDGL